MADRVQPRDIKPRKTGVISYNATMSASQAKQETRTQADATTALPPPVRWLSLPEMRFQNLYVWFVFLSALDIMLTWAILSRGGREVNPIANEVIQAWGLNGAILFKFGITVLVVIVCEVVARQRFSTARALAITAVVVSSIPVVYSLTLLLLHTMYSGQ